jgi:hypothetical protein
MIIFLLIIGFIGFVSALQDFINGHLFCLHYDVEITEYVSKCKRCGKEDILL